MSVPSGILSSGHLVPVLGFATRNLFGENADNAILTAIHSGCRHIDTSTMNENEIDVGKSLQRIYRNENIKREDLFISSKYSPGHLNSNNVRSDVRRTLSNLKTDYLDLCLLQSASSIAASKGLSHTQTIDFAREYDYIRMWKELETLQREGLIRSIGLCDFSEYQIDKIMTGTSVVPAIHQMEHSKIEEPHVRFCKYNNIVLAAYIPLRQKTATTKLLYNDRSSVKEIAVKHGKTTTQIIMRSYIQRGVVVVIESMRTAQINCKFKIFDFVLDSTDMKMLMTSSAGTKTRLRSTGGCSYARLIDIIEDKPSMHHHRRWDVERMYSEEEK
ncbi:aldo-keto reductase family 1 member B1-like [Styela clava]